MVFVTSFDEVNLKTISRWKQMLEKSPSMQIINRHLKTAAISNAHLSRVWKRVKLSGSCLSTIRHFSVTPYITICPSTETYFGPCLRGAMSAVTGIYLFRLLLNIILLS